MNISMFKRMFDESLNKPVILLPLEYALNVRKFNRLYSIPVIPFIAGHKEVHGSFTHPCWQLQHDLSIHSFFYKKYLDLTKTKIEWIRLFKIKMNISQKIYYENDNVNALFFYMIHEGLLARLNQNNRFDNIELLEMDLLKKLNKLSNSDIKKDANKDILRHTPNNIFVNETINEVVLKKTINILFKIIAQELLHNKVEKYLIRRN